MIAVIKFTKKEGWGYATPIHLNETQGLDIFIHASELINIRWKDLEAGDRVDIDRVVYNGKGYNALDVYYVPQK